MYIYITIKKHLYVTLKCSNIRIPSVRKANSCLTMTQKSVKLYIPENMLDAFYDAIRNNKLNSLHIPHSSVFYVRAAIEAKTGVRYTLKHVENAMKHEGMLEDV